MWEVFLNNQFAKNCLQNEKVKNTFPINTSTSKKNKYGVDHMKTERYKNQQYHTWQNYSTMIRDKGWKLSEVYEQIWSGDSFLLDPVNFDYMNCSTSKFILIPSLWN